MFNKLLNIQTQSSDVSPRENDVYKVIELDGVRFDIRYGYYEDVDRDYEPVPIYPDFIKEPVYTKSGAPFITLMQDPCRHYESNGRSTDRDCGTCFYAERGNDLIGVCKCDKNKK